MSHLNDATSRADVIIRVDASPDIGMGNVVRQERLATELIKRGLYITFVMREFPPAIKRLKGLTKSALHVVDWNWLDDNLPELLPDSSQTMIFDLARSFPSRSLLQRTKSRCGKIIVFHDEPRPLLAEADHIVSANPAQNALFYEDQPPDRYCVGMDYFLMDPEFLAEAHQPKHYREQIKHVLLAFGGGSNEDTNAKILSMLARWPEPLLIDLLLSDASLHVPTADRDWNHQLNVCRGIPSIVPLLEEADLVFCCASNISTESLFMGVPVVTINHTAQQDQIAEVFAARGYSVNLGPVNSLKTHQVLDCLSSLTFSRRLQMGTNGRNLTDGRGLWRVADLVTGPNHRSSSSKFCHTAAEFPRGSSEPLSNGKRVSEVV